MLFPALLLSKYGKLSMASKISSKSSLGATADVALRSPAPGSGRAARYRTGRPAGGYGSLHIFLISSGKGSPGPGPLWSFWPLVSRREIFTPFFVQGLVKGFLAFHNAQLCHDLRVKEVVFKGIIFQDQHVPSGDSRSRSTSSAFRAS